MKKLTRRTLISLAALLPVIQVEAASSERFDVIVVGAGIAGLAAAVSAAESGAKRVLVLEKGPMIGGHAIYADGTVSAVYPRLQKVFNIKDSPEQMAKQIWEWGDRDGDLSLIRVMARDSGPAIDWLRGMGVHFRDWVFVPYPSNFPRGLTSHPTRGGYEYIRALNRRARALRVEVRLNTRVVQLLRSGGAVTGVSASGPKGVERFYAASVVLATGGFSANPDMIRRYSHLKIPERTHPRTLAAGISTGPRVTVFSLEPRSARLSLKCPISNSFHFGAAGCSNTWAAIFSWMRV